MPSIDYYYSAHSAFAYLGSRKLMDIARAAKRSIAHRPVDLDQVIAAASAPAFRMRSDAHRRYFFEREIMRWSEERGAPVMGRPTYHNNDTTLCNCMLVAGVLGGLDVDALAHALLEAHWRHDADLANPDSLSNIASEAGYDASALLEAATSAPARDAYAANTREAIEHSVFGSPTYAVDGDFFYGQDRLEMVERALRQPYSRHWNG